MNQRNVIVRVLLVVGMAILFNACVVVPNGAYYRTHVPPSTVYRPATVYYEWYYFPESGVYYNISERYYYYPYNGSWRRATQLPSRLVLRYEDRVRLKLTDTPYIKYKEHRRKYPPRHHERRDHDRDRHESKENHDTFNNRYELKEHSQSDVIDQERERARDHNRDRNANINKDHKPPQDNSGSPSSTFQPRFRSKYERANPPGLSGPTTPREQPQQPAKVNQHAKERQYKGENTRNNPAENNPKSSGFAGKYNSRRADKPNDNTTNNKNNNQPTSTDNKQKHKKKNKGRNIDKKKSDEKSKDTDSQTDSNNTNNDVDEFDTADKQWKRHREQK